MVTRERIKELYSVLYKPLLKYANRILNDFDFSEDIVQESFTRLIEYSDKHYIEDAYLKAYLYKICRNLSINYLKRKTYFTFVPLEVVNKEYHCYNVQEPLTSENISISLEPYLAQLSSVHRTLFLMKLTKKLKSKEMSEITGLSERTIRRRIYEAKEHLKLVCNFQELSIW